MSREETPIQRLTHDVKSLAAILLEAAERLTVLSPSEQAGLVGDMLEPAQRLADRIKRYHDGDPRR
jgi:hypothetical protein